MIERTINFLKAIPDDKLRHVLGGVVVSVLTSSALLLAGGQSLISCLLALALVSFIAALKECYDYINPPHECSFYDWLATVIGGMLPLIPILLHR